MSKKSQNRLFGTDGIRSTFGKYPLDKESLIKLGSALGQLLQGARIVIGRDTRHSGEEITQLLISGMANKTETQDCGVFPTPGISYITDHDNFINTMQKREKKTNYSADPNFVSRQRDILGWGCRPHFDNGIMITASHNPWTDNGIKIFGSNGEKISETLEQELEEIFFSLDTSEAFHSKAASHGSSNSNGSEPKTIYRNFLSKAAAGLDPEKVKKYKIVLDCANGATFEEAPRVFRQAGFNLHAINNRPDGKNINLNCGSTMPGHLKQTVKEQQADLGIAFDGDGDRVIMVDSKGNILDGDHILYLFSKYLLESEAGANFNKVVVGTVMGNLGLEKALNRMGVKYIRTQVGDKYVYREMKQQQSILGGEQSGHIILRSLQKTGDGILTALYFLEALFYLDLDPTDLFHRLQLYPQVMKSIKIREKRELSQWDELNRMVKEFNAHHGKNSRILIRYSGTEPKIRVMIESAQESVIRENIGKLEHLIKSTIGI
jgi:phosphoglucosamine mutase